MGLKLDGIMTSEHLDSSGEVLNVAGHDISDFNEGKAVFNWEHSNKGPEDILGHIISAKKILKASDCSNDREKMYWKECQKPFVYIIGELYDDEEHPGAVAAAAMMRYYHKRKEKMLVGFSVEGATLERDGNNLERSVGRRCAITLRPCNKTCLAGILDDPKLKDMVEKSMGTRTEGLYTVDSFILEDISDDSDPIEALKKACAVLTKTLEAGNYNVAPSQLVGGAALQVEDRSLKNRVKAVFRDWDRRRPLKEAIKAALPEVSDDYVDHFTKLAEELSLKKSGDPLRLARVSADHSLNPNDTDEQKKLIEGIYYDKAHDFDPGHPEFTRVLRRAKNDNGDEVFLKYNPYIEHGQDHKNATMYHTLADKFFGMGEHVPTTTYFQHPEINQGKPVQAMKMVQDAESPLTDSDRFKQALAEGRENGSAHKLALMDMITGQTDRHHGNVLVDKGGRLIHIDNDDAFGSHQVPSHPNDIYEEMGNDSLHVDAGKWLSGLDAKKLGQHMIEHDMAPEKIKQAVTNLKVLQHMGPRGASFAQMRKAISKGHDQSQSKNPEAVDG